MPTPWSTYPSLTGRTRTLAAVSLSLARGPAGEGPVDGEGRTHQRLAGHLIDGALRLLLRVVLDERVALDEACALRCGSAATQSGRA